MRAETATTDALFVDFQKAHAGRLGEATHTKRGSQPRQRKAGAGHPFDHDLRDRLLLALVWLRVYPTYELLGWLFGLDKSNAWHNVQDVLATLEQIARRQTGEVLIDLAVRLVEHPQQIGGLSLDPELGFAVAVTWL